MDQTQDAYKSADSWAFVEHLLWAAYECNGGKSAENKIDKVTF